MATTKQSIDESNGEFGSAFDEEQAAPVEQSEDEAFGLNIPNAEDAAAEGDGETDGGEAIVQGAEDMPAEEMPAEPVAEDSPEAQAAEAEAVAGEDDMPPMTQSEKSWEGRLRAREAELKALAAELETRKAASDDAPAGLNHSVPDSADVQEQAEEVAEQLEAGEIDADEAIKQLTADFGPEFVNMIVAIAVKKANEAAGSRVDEIGATLQDVIGDIKNSRQRRHFTEIYRVHPDFVEVSDSDGFKSWVSGMDEAARADAERVINGGDSYEINELLTNFKQHAEAGDVSGPNESEIDDAEGVRSTGLRLPDAPAGGKDDFAAAWEENA